MSKTSQLRLAIMTCSLFLSLAVAGYGLAESTGMGQQQASDLSELLVGVEAIEVAGYPGSVGVIGPQAVPVILGESQSRAASVVALGRYEKGRVVLFGHTHFLWAPKDQGTKRLMQNALRWSAGKEDGIRVGVLQPFKAPGWLKEAGYNAVQITRNGNGSELDQIDVLLAMANQLDSSDQRLRSFVEQGGGLITAETGWGWQQLNNGKPMSEHPAQGLIEKAGLVVTDRYVQADSLKPADARSIESTAYVCLAGIMANKPKQNISPAASLSLASAIRCATDQSSIIKALACIPSESRPDVIPRPDKPLDLSDPLVSALINIELRTLEKLEPNTGFAHPSATAFPGAAPADSPRIDKTVKVDPAVKGWQSTGLYAQPGETIVVRTPSAASNNQLSIRIGCHTDSIHHHQKWSRMATISWAWKITGQTSRFSNPFGGLIYVESDMPAHAEKLALQIQGGIPAPYYKRGETSPADWLEQIRHAPAPWAELAGDKVILTVPSEHVRHLKNPEELMAFWDRVSDAQADLATQSRERDRPHRFVADVQISAGYMHAGYPIMTHLDAAPRMSSLEVMRKGDWGLFHELGHNHQHPDWTFEGTVEVTCNLFTLYTYEKVCDPLDQPPHQNVSEQWRRTRALSHFSKGSPFEEWKKDSFLALAMYMQLEESFGWDAYKKVFAKYRELPGDQRPKSNEQKHDLWVQVFSETTGRNLAPFFDQWGFPMSDHTRQAVTDLPAWSAVEQE